MFNMTAPSPPRLEWLREISYETMAYSKLGVQDLLWGAWTMMWNNDEIVGFSSVWGNIIKNATG
jgi:hypothetical protein